MFLLRTIKAYLCPNTINFNEVNFSEHRSEVLLTLSVFTLQILYKLKFSRWFHFREFRESNPRENFHFNLCLFIVLNDNISKMAKLTPRELPHLAKTVKITVRENNGIQYYKLEWKPV